MRLDYSKAAAYHNACIGKQAQMKKQPRISRSGENPAQPYPAHQRSATRSNILAPVAQASATGSFLKKLAFGCVCLRDGSQDVGRRPPVWGVGLLGLRVCAGFLGALIREIREIRGCCIFCGLINATEFLMLMNDAPPQELCGSKMRSVSSSGLNVLAFSGCAVQRMQGNSGWEACH
jgi:hypothetical protein